MHQVLIEQAAELYVLGLELACQQEKVALIYDRGYDIKSSLFTEEYAKLSELSTRYMQLEIAHNNLIEENIQYETTKKKQLHFSSRSRIAG